jgi:hypothetical protein
LALGRELQGVWQVKRGDERIILCKLSSLPGTLEAL